MEVSKHQNENTIKELVKKGWNLLPFNEVLVDKTSTVLKIKKNAYLKSGDTVIIDQGAKLIGGYSSVVGEKGEKECIIFGDHTRALKYIYPPFYIGADGVKVLENKREDLVRTKFIFYYLKTINIPNTGYNRHFKFLKEIVIPIIDLEIQDKIIKIIEMNENLLENRQSQLKDLEELSQSLFLEMFGDPYYNTKKWPIGKIADMTLSTQYGSGAKASEEFKKYPMLRMNNITYEGNWNFNNLKYVDLEEKELSKYLISKDQLLFNRTNSSELVGKTAVYREESPMAYAGYLVRLIPNNKGNAEYISGYLNSKYGKKLLRNMAKSIVGMANINAKELKNIVIPLPPITLQKQFSQKIQEIEAQKEQLTQSLAQYEELHQSLLQKAFRGELFQDVSN